MHMWVICWHLDGDGKWWGKAIELSTISCCIQLVPCYGARIPLTMTDSHLDSHLGSHLNSHLDSHLGSHLPIYLDQIPSNFQNAFCKLKLKMYMQVPGHFASGSQQRSGPSINTQCLLAVAAQKQRIKNEVPFYQNLGLGLAFYFFFLGSCWRNIILCSSH